MKSALSGFLGTFTSRYADYRGYWLHGQLSFHTLQYDFDLLVAPTTVETPEEFAARLANRLFAEQVEKAGVAIGAVRQARLRIRMEAETVERWHGIFRSEGHMVHFIASALMNKDRNFVREITEFVAPHDPNKEQRRLPRDWGT